MRNSSLRQLARNKKSIKRLLGTSGKLSHIDKVQVNIRMSPTKAEKEKFVLPIEKHLNNPNSLFNITGYTKNGNGEQMPIYSFYDVHSQISYTFKNNILTIAIAKEWCIYDLQEDTYHKKFVDSMEWLLSSGFISFGNGSWYRAKAYYLLNRSGTVHIEHAIDCVGIPCNSICDNVGKFYKRAGFSRLEIITSAPFKEIKDALKEISSLEIIEELKPTFVRKHVRNIFDKMSFSTINDLFGVITGKDLKYAKVKLKTVVSSLIMENDVSLLPIPTRNALHGLSHQNAI